MPSAAYFAAFAVIAWWSFRRAPGARTAWGLFLGGWLWLPVTDYPADAREALFPYWIVGSALPSPLWWNKALLVPVTVLAMSLWHDRAAWRAWRWHPLDGLVLSACLWPVATAWRAVESDPAPWSSALYLFALWAGSWWLGRLYLASAGQQRMAAAALGLSVVACLPWALVEGLGGAQTYGWFFAPHPFRDDGATRLLAYRPLGFFENGNQYGIWVALGAVAAVAWAWTSPSRSAWRWSVAAVAGAVAIASQSLGALLLAGIAVGLIALAARIAWRRWIVGSAAVLSLAAVVYAAGVMPIHHWARDTGWGREALEMVRAARLGSLAWRVSQDQKALPIVRQHPVAGQGRWDWWRDLGTRPWGLGLQMAGQFGYVGAALLLGVLLAPAVGALASAAGRSPGEPDAHLRRALALIVVAATLDALVNSFIYMPALALAGALVPGRQAAEIR